MFTVQRVFLALSLALAITMTGATSASAQTRTSITTTKSSATNFGVIQDYAKSRDINYDYELYVAGYQMNYYVVAIYKNGSVVETKHTSQSAAESYAQWLLFHIAELSTAYVDARYEVGQFYYFDTFDKLADAQYYANLFESIGLEANIHWVSAYSFGQDSLSRYLP